MKKICLKLSLCLFLAATMTSCWLIYGPFPNEEGGSRRGLTSVVVTPNFRIELVEVIGYSSAQTVTAAFIVTNREANTRGSLGSGSYAVDHSGRTANLQRGVFAELPTGVPVRVELTFSPVFGTNSFRHLQFNVWGNWDEKNRAIFRNVPILWH
jgi:hypothetical protein